MFPVIVDTMMGTRVIPQGLPEVGTDRPAGVHVVKVDYEFRMEANDLPPLDTDLSELPPLRKGGHPSKFVDGRRYDEYWYKLEQKYWEPIDLPRDKQTVVRTHRDMDAVVAEIRGKMDETHDSEILFGMDTEKDVSTLQTLIKLIDFFAKGRHYEKNVLWQIKMTPAV